MKTAVPLAFLLAASACGAAPQSGHYSWSFEKHEGMDFFMHAEIACDHGGACQVISSSTYFEPASGTRPLVASEQLTKEIRYAVKAANMPNAKGLGFSAKVAVEQVKAIHDIGAAERVLGCYMDEGQGRMMMCELDGTLIDAPGGGKTAWFYAAPDMSSGQGNCPGNFCIFPMLKRD